MGRQAPEGGDPVLAADLVRHQDGAARGPCQLGHCVEEEIEHARDVEPCRQGLGKLLHHPREHVGREVKGGPGISGEGSARRLGEPARRRAQGRDLLQQPKFLLGLAEHALEVTGGEGVEEDEICQLHRRIVFGRRVGSKDTDHHRGRTDLASALDEDGDFPGRRRLLDDQVHGGEPESPQGLLVRTDREHCAAIQAAAETTSQGLVCRDHQGRSHV